MKFCNVCQKTFPDEETVCPVCGETEDITLLTDEIEETAEAEEAEEALEEEIDEEEEEPKAKPKKQNKLLLIIIAAVLAVAVIALSVILLLPKGDDVESVANKDATGTLIMVDGHHVNAYGYPSHSIHYTKAKDGTISYSYMNEKALTVAMTTEEVEELLDDVIAVSGEHKLTNRNLPYFFEQQFYNFYMTYQDYFSYLVDPTKGMDEQLHYVQPTTWQQYLLDTTINYFLQVTTLYDEAMAVGYQLTPDQQQRLDDMETDMLYFAQQYQFDSVQAYLEDFYGPYANFEDYKQFVIMSTYADSYAYTQSFAETFTDQQLSDFYEANREDIMANYFVQKIDKNTVNVRHILIKPESTTDEKGLEVISDSAWAAAEAEAERILELWKSGEANETFFAELATTYTGDPGSQTTGGLYENVYPGQMVTEFNDWCFADGRQTGDTGIVKTNYGYHIMYFVSENDEVYWKSFVRQMMYQEVQKEIWLNALGENPTYNLTKAVLLDTAYPTIPSGDTTSGENETPIG